uniref:Si:ch211-1a19.2 n=1 Tax=Hucho hucho TaxID=62062 RepID=A0A4W5LDS3_9TELE
MFDFTTTGVTFSSTFNADCTSLYLHSCSVLMVMIVIFFLRCVHGGKPSQKDMVFSRGIQLFVEGLNPSDPSVLILSSFGSDPSASHTPTLVCVLSGLRTHLVDIIWWINNTVVTPENNVVWSSRGRNGTYTAAGLWTVSGKDWKPQNYYRCGTRHEGKLYINVTQSSLCRDFT